MKRFSLIVMAVGCVWLVHAQTNVTAPASSPAAATNPPAAPAPPRASAPPPPRAPTRIDSDDSADFDLNGHRAIYRGHVRVDDPEMKLTCGLLIADVPSAGGHPDRIVAETNVVIDFTDTKGQTNHATSDKAVYVYSVQNGVTNETVTLTGNPQMENAQGTQAGDVIIWDRASNKIHFDNPRMVFRQNLGITSAETNPPPAKTNLPPETIQNTAQNTNQPAGNSAGSDF
jgi:lipopolysaccharide export system protein LptA